MLGGIVRSKRGSRYNRDTLETNRYTPWRRRNLRIYGDVISRLISSPNVMGPITFGDEINLEMTSPWID